jgi:type IV fimbrial biogenesis protein FimT
MFKNAPGFSLIELMVVLAVIVILGVVSAPNMVTGIPKYRIKAAAQDVTSQLRRARAVAVRENRAVTVVFDRVQGQYVVDGRRFPYAGTLSDHYGSGVAYGFGSAAQNAVDGGSLPGSPVTFAGSPGQVTFNSQGLANPGAVYFTNNKQQAYCVVVSAAGGIGMLHWSGSTWR